ncbi:MAG: hypothetical protein B6242_07625 [Anaerolineaceae bacterium 4572_78]|nr:MAG: hypothetical protein B6242_07625 [Anaerolineaceae bacterium 4572_78]
MKKYKNRNEFEHAIFAVYAESYDCNIEKCMQPGTVLIPDKRYADSNFIIMWYAGKAAFIEVDPALSDKVQQLIAAKSDTKVFQPSDFITAWGDKVEIDHEGNIYYLYPDDFKPFIPTEPFTVRFMSEKDKPYMDAMYAECTEKDIDEAYVEIDHTLVCGCFQGEKLVSAASMYYTRQGEIFSDLGVITHPDFRGNGLGKGAVSKICEWLLVHDKIAQYRSSVTILGSNGIAKSLGFTHYYKQFTLKIND